MTKPQIAFEQHRQALTALAYRMTGSVADAEDIVQEAYLRWERSRGPIRNLRAFLSTTVTRLCLDSLKSARKQRERYVGPWLPEPMLDSQIDTGIDTRLDTAGADDRAELAQDISVALMLTLERLSPLERAAFLLHEVFDFSHQEVAAVLDRTPAACRQLASRAKKHVTSERPRFQASEEERQRVVLAFGAAVMSGDLETLEATLADDAVLYSDGGGRVKAALRPIVGANRIARFFLGILKKNPLDANGDVRPRRVNGSPGFVVFRDGVLEQTLAFDVREGVVTTVYAVRNPEKLERLQLD